MTLTGSAGSSSPSPSRMAPRSSSTSSPKGQKRVDRLGHDHRDAHCRGANQPRDFVVLGLNDDSLADRELPVMLVVEHRLQALLQRPSEPLAVREIDPAIHEAETVRGADDRIGRDSEDVAAGNCDVLGVAEVLSPGANRFGVLIAKMDLHGGPGPG